MERSDVARWLSKTALDESFRELARTDPDASFEGFELTEDEMAILRRQDSSMLLLLGQALHPAQPEADRPEVAVELPVPGRPLEPVDVVLQVVPIRVEGDELKLVHAVTLFAADSQPRPLPEGLPEGAMAAMEFAVRIQPHAVAEDTLRYSATIVPGGTDADTAAEDETPAPFHPWSHVTEGDAVRAAAAAVKAAAPEDRYDRLLELIAAITTPEGSP